MITGIQSIPRASFRSHRSIAVNSTDATAKADTNFFGEPKKNTTQDRSKVKIVFITIASLLYQQLVIIAKNIYLVAWWRNRKARTERKQNFQIIDCSKNACSSENVSYTKSTDCEINFPLSSSYIVVSDIINSTYLYNENPRRMKNEVDIHNEIALRTLRQQSGHIVANEGDSFSIVFENLNNAIEFSKNFIDQLKLSKVHFKIRIGINNGFMNVRKYYGYKCFGKPIDEINEIIKHNCGERICIKGILLDQISVDRSCICVH